MARRSAWRWAWRCVVWKNYDPREPASEPEGRSAGSRGGVEMEAPRLFPGGKSLLAGVFLVLGGAILVVRPGPASESRPGRRGGNAEPSASLVDAAASGAPDGVVPEPPSARVRCSRRCFLLPSRRWLCRQPGQRRPIQRRRIQQRFLRSAPHLSSTAPASATPPAVCYSARVHAACRTKRIRPRPGGARRRSCEFGASW